MGTEIANTSPPAESSHRDGASRPDEVLPGQTAMTLAADGMALSIEPLSDGARADFARIIRDFIASGHPFSADELREALDAAGIPTSARGGLMAGAIRSGLIREVGTKRSVHSATHGKRIGVYKGADPPARDPLAEAGDIAYAGLLDTLGLSHDPDAA